MRAEEGYSTKLKISKEHYNLLCRAIHRARAQNQDIEVWSETNKGARWALLRYSVVEGVPGITWICDNLYSYMNDEHIDSALKAITGWK